MKIETEVVRNICFPKNVVLVHCTHNSTLHMNSLQVELLVMRALSLELVKGSIDQVDKKVHMTWVQPRVLDRDQVLTGLGFMSLSKFEWC